MVASADEQVAEAMRKKGWQVLTKGWPDLFVYKPPEFRLGYRWQQERSDYVQSHNAMPWYEKIRYPSKFDLTSRGSIMAIELKRGNDKMRSEQIEMSHVFKDMLNLPFYVARDEDIKGMMLKKGARFPMPGSSMQEQLRKIEDTESKLRLLQSELDRMKAELDNVAPLFEPLDA